MQRVRDRVIALAAVMGIARRLDQDLLDIQAQLATTEELIRAFLASRERVVAAPRTRTNPALYALAIQDTNDIQQILHRQAAARNLVGAAGAVVGAIAGIAEAAPDYAEEGE